MSQKAKPWTVAIDALLSDGEWHTTEEALAAGAAEVPVERALQEMGSKQSGQPEDRRVQIGRRNVAMQAVTGMTRFGKAEFGESKKKIRKVGDKSRSLGDLATRVEELEAKLEDALGQIESMQLQLDRLDGDSEKVTPDEQFLASVGLGTQN